MIGLMLTQYAEGAASRYATLLHAFTGSWSHASQQNDPLMPRTRTNLARNAFQIADTYLAIEQESVAEVTREIALNAVSDALKDIELDNDTPELSDRVSEHVNATIKHAVEEITLQVNRDILNLLKKLQAWALDVDMIQFKHQLSRRDALVRKRIQGDGPEFYFRDRAGRKLKAEKFVRQTWRQHLLLVYVETYLFTIMEHGFERATLKHPDLKHQFAGREFDIATEYPQMRNDLFHPNTNLFVEVVL
jgi:hypothetical protein